MGLELRFTVWFQYQFIEKLRVQKVRIGLSSFGPLTWLFRIAGNGDLFPDLETHFKVFGNLVQIFPELVWSRRPVKGRIVADRPETRLPVIEILAILSQTFPRKRRLCVWL